MDREFVAVELLHKVGSGGVTSGSIALVLEAFDAVVADAAKPVAPSPAVEAVPKAEAPVVDVAPSK